MRKYICILFIALIAGNNFLTSQQQYLPIVPFANRGTSDAERRGTHDANNIRTEFWNYGMVGNFFGSDADLNISHSAEVPKGSGMNYSDGITPFVLAKIKQKDASTAFIMETGYREGQGTSVSKNRIMRFEPRPGYFQSDPAINKGRSPALSNDPRTWPSAWPDKDTSYNGRWNGYFGTSLAFAPDQESFTVMDDQYYDAWDFQPDNRDATRYGLGLKVEVRGFQWSNPQAGNVVFWHYDIVNEGTTDYPSNGDPENMIFGIYMDSGVGGSSYSPCDNVYESDDDNAKFDVSSGLNLVYTWDNNGHGVDLISKCDRTGYLGYAYLETPGKPYDNVDNDRDGIIDESRSSGPGQKIVGKQDIMAYIVGHPEKYNITNFEATYGKIEDRPAYKAGVWWTGDEDLDWVAALNDFGEDGEPDTHDKGEGDGIPTDGEQNFDKTDLHESDQVGLTAFRMFRITDNPGGDGGITFYKTPNAKQPSVKNNYDGDYPHYFYDYFTGKAQGPFPGPFDLSSPNNMNIGFLFASGPFTLKAATQERFSLALAFGNDLTDLRNTVKVVQTIYNGNYKFATPPPAPTLTAEAGDGYVQLHWTDVAEHSTDPTTNINDFEGYKIYRATDYNFNDVNTVIGARGISQTSNGNPLAQYDLKDGISGYSSQIVNGLAYYLGNETGLAHSFRDSTVTNGQEYYYAVTSYDFGATIIQGATGESFTFYPAENSMSVTRTLLGGVILPKNVVAVRPNPKVLGYNKATTSGVTRIAGTGEGTVSVKVLNSALVPNNHVMKVTFNTNPDSVHPISYNLVDSTNNNKILFNTGDDFNGEGTGISDLGIQPIVQTPKTYQIDTTNSKFVAGSKTNAQLDVQYNGVWPVNYRRDGFPSNFVIKFSNSIIDTALPRNPVFGSPLPVKFTILFHNPNGDKKAKFTFLDNDNDSTLSFTGSGGIPDEIQILTGPDTSKQSQRVTWQIRLKNATSATMTPVDGDIFEMKFLAPLSSNDVFVFNTTGEFVESNSAKEQFKEGPYVVPNPYVGAASFEPAPFGVQGRGDRKMEFRNLPKNCVIRIYTVRGELVRTLRQDGSTNGYVSWDVRTKDNLDVAPGLYIFQVDGGGVGTSIGKFAIIK
ncbi:MAG: hypothetical protein PHP42_01915 [Bacteroidota bacterium]|nr:hypothetical protein [Bacteroidota bacterium]